jgi:hypothetical protein
MRRRIMFWGVVCCGLVGALLWAEPVGAQPFPGGLPACLAKLNICNASLGTCQTDLAACLAEPPVVFPGDGGHGPALSYHDNGDGTVTDNNTLLVWEKKVSGSSCLHCVDDTYTFANATGAFLAAINAEGGSGLGGHSDWRVPNVKELQSIVDYSKSFPDPTIASGFPGSTAADFYWSSTPYAGLSSLAWGVGFDGGGLSVGGKIFSQRVRAVRGGR